MLGVDSGHLSHLDDDDELDDDEDDEDDELDDELEAWCCCIKQISAAWILLFGIIP